MSDRSPERAPTIFTSAALLLAGLLFLYLALLRREAGLYLLSALLLLIPGGARLWAAVGLRGVRAGFRVEAARVFPGQALALEARVRRHRRLPVAVRLDWAANGAFRLRGGGPQRGLLWRRALRFRGELVALRRGVHRLPPPRLQGSDPLGLFARELEAGSPATVIVYPRLVALRRAAPPQRELFGSARSRGPVPDPAWVLGTRDYRPGGPARHIHWKASARLPRLQEKVFEPTAQGGVLLALEVGGYEQEGAGEPFERTLEVMASLAVQLERRGFAVGLAANGGAPVLPPGRGGRQLPSLLEALARLERRRSAPLEQVLLRASCLRRGSSCIAFLHEAGEPGQGLARLCRRFGVPVLGYACRPARRTEDARSAEGLACRPLVELLDAAAAAGAGAEEAAADLPVAEGAAASAERRA